MSGVVMWGLHADSRWSFPTTRPQVLLDSVFPWACDRKHAERGQRLMLSVVHHWRDLDLSGHAACKEVVCPGGGAAFGAVNVLGDGRHRSQDRFRQGSSAGLVDDRRRNSQRSGT